jgi:hypothetical protein
MEDQIMTNLNEHEAQHDKAELSKIDVSWIETELQMRLLIDAAMHYQDTILLDADDLTQDELKMIDEVGDVGKSSAPFGRNSTSLMSGC